MDPAILGEGSELISVSSEMDAPGFADSSLLTKNNVDLPI